MCLGVSQFSAFLHPFVLAKLAVSSTRVNDCNYDSIYTSQCNVMVLLIKRTYYVKLDENHFNGFTLYSIIPLQL